MDRAALLVLAALAMTPQAASACSATTDCTVASGMYRVVEPEGAPEGAILFFHGWQGSAEAEMRNESLADVARVRGLLLVVPDGLGKTWSYPGSPRRLRDEFAFVREVTADVERRFGVGRARTLVTGFSMGGSMAWNVACYEGAGFAGFAPIAGAFWDPIPESCPSPTPILLHTHGTADRTVPLEGRPIGESWRQSDVFDSLAMWRRQGHCEAPPTVYEAGLLTCERTTCSGSDGGVIELCLHSGGHSIRTEWVARGWDMLAELKGW